MATTTPVYGWPVPDLNDSPNAPQQFSDLADAIETTVNRTVTVGVPGTSSVTLSPSAWTTIASVSITLPVDTVVDVVGWARIVNSGSGEAQAALQVLDGSTHLFGTGQGDAWGTGDANGQDLVLNTPRRSVGLTAGAHTLNLQAWKGSAGTLAAKQTSTFGSQDIAVTGIEATY